ncbi:GNAT family N-acetyltransferase [Bacillus sp. C1-1]|nr:GNAT family N-acetyltransferase [Bacillus sp. C1-1]
MSIMSKALAVQLETSEIDMLHSRLSEIQKMKGNPMNVDIQTFGNATAFTVKNIPGPSFNTVKGLKDGDEDQLDKIVHFYKQKKIPIRFELTPAHTSSDLLTSLNEAGFFHNGFHTTLYAPLVNTIETHNELTEELITVRTLRKDEFDTYAKIYTKGFQMPASLTAGIAQNNKILHHLKNWDFYIASYQNEPAGIGVLFTKDGVATLAAAATFPHLRKKGIHSALIKHRIYQAQRQRCQFIVGQATFGSSSQNNMERAGLSIAYTKAIWVGK